MKLSELTQIKLLPLSNSFPLHSGMWEHVTTSFSDFQDPFTFHVPYFPNAKLEVSMSFQLVSLPNMLLPGHFHVVPTPPNPPLQTSPFCQAWCSESKIL